MTTPTLPFGTAVALAQRTLTQPLMTILAEKGLEPGAWFTLHALGLRGGTLSAKVATDLLATNGYDEAAADELYDRLAASGDITVGEGALSLTGTGSDHYASVRDHIDTVTRRIFDQFDADRVELARAFLQELAELDQEELGRIAFPTETA